MSEKVHIVELELLRKRIYENEIINWLFAKLGKYLRNKEIFHLALRFIFNKNITKMPDDDPIFITSESKIADEQLEVDLKFHNIHLQKIPIFLNEQFNKALTLFNIQKKNVLEDKHIKITENCKEGIIIYGNRQYQDISNLAKKNPDKVNYALALNIRYTYLTLTTNGLARDFKGMGYKTNQSTEGFASAFNRYFDNYCSAFPDLESVFGSRGSFFDTKTWSTDIVYINPPFDEVLMSLSMQRIYQYLRENPESKIKFIFTLPNWPNWDSLEQLKKSEWTIDSKVFLKSERELPFIDYMNDCIIIYPCDIAEVYLQGGKRDVSGEKDVSGDELQMFKELKL